MSDFEKELAPIEDISSAPLSQESPGDKKKAPKATEAMRQRLEALQMEYEATPETAR